MSEVTTENYEVALGIKLRKSKPTEHRYFWDKKLDFAKTRESLVAKLVEERQKDDDDPMPLRHRFYLSCLLVQLVNGSRVSEAHDAVWQWAESGERDISVRVRKQRKNPDERKMLIPPEIEMKDVSIIQDEGDRLTIDALKKFAKRTFGWNTHALRYSQITQLSDQGVPLHVIAKVTHHRNVNFLVDYTNQVVADKKLKELVG